MATSSIHQIRALFPAAKQSHHSPQSKSPTSSAAARAPVPTAAILQSRVPNRKGVNAIAQSPSDKFRRSSAAARTVPTAAILQSSVPNRQRVNAITSSPSDRFMRSRAVAAARTVSTAAILQSSFPNRENVYAIASSPSDRIRRSRTAVETAKRSDHSLQSKAPTISAAATTVPTAAISRSSIPNRENMNGIASSPSDRFMRSRAAILRPRVPNREGQNGIASPQSDRFRRCRAAAETAETAAEVGERRSGVPVYVMMPLDSVTVENNVNRRKATEASFQAMKTAGVEGVMVDVWWGLVEKERSGEYNFGGYEELLAMAAKYGLKVQAVMSFHQCGGNVGDSCTIPLPSWVVESMQKDPELAYTDQWGRRNFEYVSLGCDNVPVLKGRTPVQCYADFMSAFKQTFNHLLGNTIVEIQVGMGPAGELRYPSYPEQNGTWRFPGIGAFQCFDKYMLGSLKSAADVAGKPEWGSTGPTDAGSYNNWPEDTLFFKKEGGGWNSSYGEFFLSWYSQILLDHGDRILSHARSIFEPSSVKISVKISGIHWHYGTRSHAPELTAGYYNTRYRDGYFPIAQMLARHGAIFNFTCIEMRDHEQPQDALCAPEKLVRQVSLATQKAQVPLAGENALPRYDEYAHEQIVRTSSLEANREMCAFTYLRMSPQLFEVNNWTRFVRFVHKMKEEKTGHRSLEEKKQQVGKIVPNVQANFV